MQIESTRFGILDVRDDTVIAFPNGLIGLPGTRYVLVAQTDRTPFYWLHSAEHDDIAVPVTMPWLFFADYEVRVPDEDAAQLMLGDTRLRRDLLRRQRRRSPGGLHDQPGRAGDRERRPEARTPDHQRRGRLRCSAASVLRGGAERGAGRRGAVLRARNGDEVGGTAGHARDHPQDRRARLHRRRHHRRGARRRPARPFASASRRRRAVPIFRHEIWLEVKAENRAAAEASIDHLPADALRRSGDPPSSS